jgi:membrane-associated protease RseP (regulator of RpoE activity)
MAILAAIAILGLLVVVHELGHFLAARLQGIHVNRFSIGFGPVLWKYQGPETEYALRGIPLGGYVGFPDDDPDSSIPKDDPNLLGNRPVLDRAIVISAGVIANLIFAYLLLIVQIGAAGIPEAHYRPGVVVPQIVSDKSSAAAKAGLQAGDVILAANGQTFEATAEAPAELTQIIKNNPRKPIQLQVQRDGEQLSLTVTPEVTASGTPLIGVQLIPNVEKITRNRTLNPLTILQGAASEFQRIFVVTAKGFGQLVSNFRETAGQISGPVAIVAVGANIAQSDSTGLLWFGALISINLAILNILPLPALDGGQLAFLAIEGVRGKPLPSRIQDGVMQTGILLLLGLGIFLIIRDTANLEWVQKLFQ